ncbi:MAG: hypothetical protein ACRDMV_05120 [Streptosporangiales bacterium]
MRTATAVPLLVLTAMGALTGCAFGPDEEPAALPPITATPTTPAPVGTLPSPSLTPTPTPTGTAGMSNRKQVKFVYLRVAAAYRKAKQMPAEDRRSYLARWMVDPALGIFVDAMAREDRRQERITASRVPHVFNVTVDGDVAHVDDCSDDSQSLRKDTDTGEVVGGGSEHLWYAADLKETSDGWRVYRTSIRSEPCAGY